MNVALASLPGSNQAPNEDAAAATALVDVYEAMEWGQALRMLVAEGPAEWLRRVREVELADASKERWPRYKVSDDATIALCADMHG